MSGWLEENIFLRAERFHAQEKRASDAAAAQSGDAPPRRPPSAARLRAQRANAQRSTGPRSAKGKRRSAMNGLKFGSFEGFLRSNGYPVDELRQIWRDLAAIFWFVDPVDRYGSLEWCALRWWSKVQLLRGEPIKTNRKPAGAGDRSDRSEADRSEQQQELDSAIENYLGDMVTRYAGQHRHWKRRLLKHIGPGVLSGGTRPLRLAVEARLETFKSGAPLDYSAGTNPIRRIGSRR